MSFIEALILGIIQGLTEFLPVSSSGHIELGKVLFGLQGEGEANLFFTVLLHAATALSTVVIFRKDIWDIIKGFLAGNKESLLFVAYIVFSMIPAALVGILLEEQIDALFTGNLVLVGLALLVTGILLFISDKIKDTAKAVSTSTAIIIGIAQAIAILPGISRSGSTIATSVLLKIDRSKAARFSFLMVVPLIFGKMAKDLLDGGGAVVEGFSVNYMVGFFAAFLTGLLACKWMIQLVKKSKLSYFAYYCFAVGGISLIGAFIS